MTKLLQPNDIILDTETTGLGAQDEIVQIAIIDAEGHTLLNSLVAAEAHIWEGAWCVHHIDKKMLNKAPHWTVLWPAVADIFNRTYEMGGRIWAYNASFDARLIAQTCHRYDLDVLNLEMKCAMEVVGERRKLTEVYEAFCGVPVQAPAHSAIGDCLRVKGVLKCFS